MLCCKKKKWFFFGFVALAIVALLIGSRFSLAQYLPYLVFLACPLMHIFMMKQHGEGHGKECCKKKQPTNEDTQ